MLPIAASLDVRGSAEMFAAIKARPDRAVADREPPGDAGELIGPPVGPTG